MTTWVMLLFSGLQGYSRVSFEAHRFILQVSIAGLGTILEENLEENCYITSIKLGIGGSILAYAIIVRTEENIRITSYAREGLIKRKLAEKAANFIVKALKAHTNKGTRLPIS